MRFTDLVRAAIVLSVALAWNQVTAIVVERYAPDSGFPALIFAAAVTAVAALIITVINCAEPREDS